MHPGESFSHRIAASRGGSWAPSNGVRACGDGTRGCHGALERNRAGARAGGWHIEGSARRPSEVPVYLRHIQRPPGWYLLDDYGGMVEVDPGDLPDVPLWLPYREHPCRPAAVDCAYCSPSLHGDCGCG